VLDSDGNTLQKRQFELQNGQLVHQSWERFTYTTINGMAGLQTSKKWTALEKNVDQSRYQEGDFSLALFRYDSEAGTLKETLEWSSDVKAFAITKSDFDAYGNEVSVLDPSGLKITTTYDKEHHTLPIQAVHEADGISHSQFSAYDGLSGLRVAHRDTKGLLTCFAYDAFGRCIQSKQTNVDVPGTHQTALEFLGSTSSVCHGTLATELTRTSLNPQRSMRFERVTTSSSSTYLCTASTLESGYGPSGRTEIVEAVNCANMVCRRSSKHGEMPKSWKYWHYNTQGLQVLQSSPMFLPTTVQAGAELDFTPDVATCTRIEYNVIGQLTKIIRPGRMGRSHSVVAKLEYLSGGATLREQRLRREAQGDKLLSTVSKTVAQFVDEECITEVVDENGLKSSFIFDAAGRLIACQDAGGKSETRTYNSRGQIVTLNNWHQNM
jgi:YD repeat-containing protein